MRASDAVKSLAIINSSSHPSDDFWCT